MWRASAKTSIFLILTILLVMGAKSVFTIDLSFFNIKNIHEREKAYREIVKNRKELISKLIEFASQKVERIDPNDPTSEYPLYDSKHLSILLLGEMRADEAVPVLLENLEYENPDQENSFQMIQREAFYPAVNSLIKIGMSAVEPVIKKMVKYDKDCISRQNCVFILRYILGIPLARERLKIYIEETNDPIAKKNIESVLPLFKTDWEKYQEELEQRKAAEEIRKK